MAVKKISKPIIGNPLIPSLSHVATCFLRLSLLFAVDFSKYLHWLQNFGCFLLENF